jgi:hypothetical protein
MSYGKNVITMHRLPPRLLFKIADAIASIKKID